MIIRYYQNYFISVSRISLVLTVFLSAGINSSIVHADVDKIYHPYVEAQTYEIETRILRRLNDSQASDLSIYRFGFGKDISEKLYAEFYIIGDKNAESTVDVEAYEVEFLYQIGEQGQYWADLGFILEIEKESESNEWEGNLGIILEREFGPWSATVNLQNQYFFEGENDHEWSTNSAFQLRYRNSPLFEPGIEIYGSKDSVAFGPVFLGQVKFDSTKLNWEIGIMKETKPNGPHSVIRALLEYEF